MKVLLDGFADPSPLYGSGFHIDGVKYTVIAATDKTIRGKQVGLPPLREQEWLPGGHRKNSETG
jgi:hypothetical protein